MLLGRGQVHTSLCPYLIHGCGHITGVWLCTSEGAANSIDFSIREEYIYLLFMHVCLNGQDFHCNYSSNKFSHHNINFTTKQKSRGCWLLFLLDNVAMRLKFAKDTFNYLRAQI